MSSVESQVFDDSVDDTSNVDVGVDGVVFWSQVFLFVMTLGLSATVEVKHLRQRLSNTYAIGCGVALQYIVMPSAGLLSVFLFRNSSDFTPAMGITLLVLTSSPGGSYSTWWCQLWNADLPLSVAMTTVSSILGVILLPFNLYITTRLAYGKEASVVESVDFTALLQSLALVICAICAGLMAGYIWDTPTFHERASMLGNASGLGLVVLGVAMTTQDSNDQQTETIEIDQDTQLWEQPWALYMAVAIPFFVGMALPNIVAQRCLRLSKPEIVAISIECCYQNNGIATSVAMAMFQGMALQRTQAFAVPFIYGLLEATCIPIYCLWAWKAGWTKAPPGGSICTVLAKSYENFHDEIVHPHACDLEETTAVDTVKWINSESTMGYSPISVHRIDTRIDDSGNPPLEDHDLKECTTFLAKKFNEYKREDTLDTVSEENCA